MVFLIGVFFDSLGDELRCELTVGDGYMLSYERAGARFAGSGSFAKWGLVTGSELVFFP